MEVGMEMVPIKPERKAQLGEYAMRHGRNTVEALDEALAAYLEWERCDVEQTVQSVLRGYEDVKSGRTRPAADFLDELRRKHGRREPIIF